MDDRGQHQIVPRDPLGQGLRDMVFQHVEPEAGFLVPGLLLGLFDQSERTPAIRASSSSDLGNAASTEEAFRTAPFGFMAA